MLAELMGSKVRSKVIGLLFCHPSERFFVRQIEGIVGEDSTNLSRELARLAELGVLAGEAEGRQKYYRANGKCPIFEELRGLAVKTVGVADVLREALGPLKDRIAVAFIYGSQASGDFGPSSDVDVMIIGRATFGEVVAATSGLREKLRREVNTTTYPPEEWREKAVLRHYFVVNVLAGPKVFLIGDERELAELAGERLAEEAPGNP